MESQVLQQVKTEKLPPPEIACRECQYATWMEFKAGPKCYCQVTQAWMFEPNQNENKWVLACDKQMEETELKPAKETQMEAAPRALTVRHEKSEGVDEPLMPGDTKGRNHESGQMYVVRANGQVQWKEALPLPGNRYILRGQDGTEKVVVAGEPIFNEETQSFGLATGKAPKKKATAEGFLGSI